MRKVILAGLLATVSFAASAQWVTNVEDDIFSGGKKATMLATNSSDSLGNGMAFDCTKDELSFSYVEKAENPEKIAGIDLPLELVVKVGKEDTVKMQGKFAQRNDQYWQASTTDVDNIKKILKQSSSSAEKFLVGLNVPALDSKFSLSTNLNGSKKAISEFTAACGIKLD